MNRLLSYNLSRPINSRVHAPDSLAHEVARMRGNAVALLVTIHTEIAPILSAKRKADDLLERCLRSSHEKQGYVNAPGSSSRLEIHTLRPCSQLSDLTIDNEPVGATFIRGMDKAENETRGFNLA